MLAQTIGAMHGARNLVGIIEAGNRAVYALPLRVSLSALMAFTDASTVLPRPKQKAVKPLWVRIALQAVLQAVIAYVSGDCFPNPALYTLHCGHSPPITLLSWSMPW